MSMNTAWMIRMADCGDLAMMFVSIVINVWLEFMVRIK